MIWHEVTFVYYKDGSRQAWRSAADTTESPDERPKSTRKYQKGKSIYTEWYPTEQDADMAIENFKEIKG